MNRFLFRLLELRLKNIFILLLSDNISSSLIIVIVYFMYIEKRNEMDLVNKQNTMIEKNYQDMIYYIKRKIGFFMT